MHLFPRLSAGLVVVAALVAASPAAAYTIQFDNSDFTVTPVFNNVTFFTFSIEVDAPLAPGVYNNPALVSVDYTVNGVLTTPTPSGFPAFSLVRTMTGAEFYAQGSSLSLEIAGGADLSDGLQLFELVGGSPVFTLNAREVNTGRYHPPVLTLNSDGTGVLQNSNNNGGVNIITNETVGVQTGQEYIVNLGFAARSLTLAEATAVPEPATGFSFGAALALAAAGMRRKRRQ